MTLMQLTVIVAVNMMGIRHHHAADQHGQGRSDLAPVLGRDRDRLDGDRLRPSREAGVLDSRSGGMSRYAEEAHGKSGFFMVSYLYYLSLAIGNVAIAISASDICPRSSQGSAPLRSQHALR
jgi:putrescine:ornithine antiporter